MLADARKGRFDTIVCWKSDRLSRGMYPAAALMEVVEAHQIGLEAVLDAIDMKTFGLMAAIGKIELDNFRERSTMGKRGTAKQGRAPTGRLPYGYRIGDDGRPEVVEEQAEVVRRIFRMYVDEGMRAYSIAARLTDEGVPTQTGKLLWLQSRVHHILGNATYTGSWVYGKYRHVATEDGMKVYDQPKDTWIEIPVTRVVDDKTWKRAQELKKQRSRKAKRNTKVLYLLQHLLKCAECGRNFHTRASWTTTSVRNGKPYTYELTTPRRYYMCNGMQSMRLGCRERPHIRAERLEEPIWSEVKRVIQNPDLIVAGIDTLDAQEGGGLEEEMAQAERDLRSIQMEEDRAIRLFVSGKITEAQLDHQRKFITERLESARAKLDDYRAREASGTEKRRLMETILTWAREVGQGLDELTPEQRKEILQMVVEQVVIDRDNNVDITLAIPIDDDSSDPDSPDPESPQPECVSIGSQEPSRCGSFWNCEQPKHMPRQKQAS
jgi:site-specific DNA recombinase